MLVPPVLSVRLSGLFGDPHVRSSVVFDRCPRNSSSASLVSNALRNTPLEFGIPYHLEASEPSFVPPSDASKVPLRCDERLDPLPSVDDSTTLKVDEVSARTLGRPWKRMRAMAKADTDAEEEERQLRALYNEYIVRKTAVQFIFAVKRRLADTNARGCEVPSPKTQAKKPATARAKKRDPHASERPTRCSERRRNLYGVGKKR